MKFPLVISFASGKGGVGKSTVVSNLGCTLSREYKTLLIDADWFLGKLSFLFGKKPTWTLEHVLNGEVPIEKAVSKINENLFLLSSPSGLLSFNNIQSAERVLLFYELEKLMQSFDIVCLDHSSGIDDHILPFVAASHHHCILTTSEPASFADSYAIIKLLSKKFAVKTFQLVVSQVTHLASETERVRLFLNFTQKELLVKVNDLAFLPFEKELRASAYRQIPLVEEKKYHPFSQSILEMTRKLIHLTPHQSAGLFYQLKESSYEPTYQKI